MVGEKEKDLQRERVKSQSHTCEQQTGNQRERGTFIRKGYLPAVHKYVVLETKGLSGVTEPKSGASATCQLLLHVVTKRYRCHNVSREEGDQEGACSTNQQCELPLKLRNSTCCRILGVDCRDKKGQTGAEHVNEGKGAQEKSSR
jgi:hypothetical protein